MRFFQHFLIHCYPHHPIGAESIWTHEIPCLSEKVRLTLQVISSYRPNSQATQYQYLMHAILGLAASDLSVQHDPTLVASAMSHRLKAIIAIKKTLSDVPRTDTFEEGNALMATCFALTFQSVLLDDGMVEYMTFIRGVIIVAIQMYFKGAKLLFGEFLGDRQKEVMRPFMEKVPLIEGSWADAAVAAVEGLGGLCMHPMEQAYHGKILEMARQLKVSSWGGKSQQSHRSYIWRGTPCPNARLQPTKQCRSTTRGGCCFPTISSSTSSTRTTRSVACWRRTGSRSSRSWLSSPRRSGRQAARRPRSPRAGGTSSWASSGG